MWGQGSSIFNFDMKLIFKICLSLVIAVVVLVLLEIFVKTGLEKNKNHKISFIAQHPINAAVLIHGPCESEWAIDPDALSHYTKSKVYNLSLNHSDFADNYLFLYEYLKHQPAPQAVVLYATPESFDSTISNTFNTYRFTYLLKDDTVRSVVKEIDPVYAKWSNIPFMKYSYYSNFIFYKSISGWINFLLHDTVAKYPTGYVAPVASFRNAFKNFRDLNPRYGTFLWSAGREKYFIKIIELLSSKNIPLVVYESPVYYEAEPMQKNRNVWLKRIDSICTVNNVPYRRFDSMQLKYDKSNYFSTYNLTLKGVADFTPVFGKFLQDSLPVYCGIHK
jgi:hypothetical protein